MKLRYIKDGKLIPLPKGVDHERWIERGKRESQGIKIEIVEGNEKFGWLHRDGWISVAELNRAKKGKAFRWLSSGIVMHEIPSETSP